MTKTILMLVVYEERSCGNRLINIIDSIHPAPGRFLRSQKEFVKKDLGKHRLKNWKLWVKNWVYDSVIHGEQVPFNFYRKTGYTKDLTSIMRDVTGVTLNKTVVKQVEAQYY